MTTESSSRRVDQLFEFGRFVVAGSTAAGLYFALFIILVEVVDASPVLAAIIAYAAGFLASFLLQYHYAFQSKQSYRHTIKPFVGMHMIGFLGNTSIMYLGVERIGVDYLVTQAFAAAFIVVNSYLLQKFYVFRR